MNNKLELLLKNYENCIITHTEYNSAINGIINCYEETFYSPSESINCMIIADGGLGKTTVCNKVIEMFPSIEVTSEGHKILVNPALYIKIPPNSSIDNLTKIILHKLGDEKPSYGTAFDRYLRLTAKLRISKTKLIIFDEFHHIYSSKNSKDKNSSINESIANWIKSLGDENQISICLASLPGYEDIFLRDTQQSRRFKDIFYIHPLTIHRDNNRTHIKPFLKQLQEFIRNEIHIDTIDLTNDELVLQIYIATNGNIDFLKKFIKRALILQIKSSDPVLNLRHFEITWNTGITDRSKLSDKNPFIMKEQELLNFYDSITK